MREILSSMKGKVFKSYECVLYDCWGYIVTPLRINLGSFAVDIKLAHEEVPGWRELDPLDYPDTLRCWEMGLDSPFLPDTPGVTEYLVGERITGVEIINDYIEFGGSPRCSVDVAIAIHTKRNVYTFSRGVWFTSIILPEIADEVVVPYTVEECADDWGEGPDGEEVPAQVTRTNITL